jgi:polysaccharide export outer membrane protein
MFRRLLGLFLVTASLFAAANVYAADTVLHARDQAYRLQPSDQLQIEYRYTPEYNEALTVQPDGYVTMRLVGDVKIGDLTLEQARARILDKLKTRLNNPEITLTLTDFVHPSFTVVGQVGAPGRFELHGTVTAIDAIAMAGGLKDSAKHSQVILFRRAGDDMASTHILNLKKLMNPKHPHLDEDVVLEPGDLLVVPKNRISKIADYVHWVSVGGYFPL